MKIGIIGMGNMGGAIAKALSEHDLYVYDINQEKISDEKHPMTSEKEVVENADYIFLAVKPQYMAGCIDNIGKNDEKIFISIAAGLKIEFFEKYFKKVVRVMPNTPCLVGEMSGAYANNEGLNNIENSTVHGILNFIGTCLHMQEDKINAMTPLSGSGPAFFAYISKAMVDAAVELGIERHEARLLAQKTMLGTAKMLEIMSEDELMTMVASPGGSTRVGLDSMDEDKVSDAIKKMTNAAYQKNIELGE